MSALQRIFDRKREEVATAKARVSVADLHALIRDAETPRGFLRAIQQSPRGLALIAEVKKASPSQGLIRANFDAAAVAKSYESAGADCLSVLTDVDFFQGHPENLRIARRSTGLPALRKDFLYDPYQVMEARAWGADAVLLIVAMLEPNQVTDLQAQAWELGMDVLVEVHTEAEVEVALGSKSTLIGVNNRNLADFTTDIAMSERLLPMITPYATAVSESALETRADLDRVQAAGARAVLIGTSFCASPDIEAKVREVMGT